MTITETLHTRGFRIVDTGDGADAYALTIADGVCVHVTAFGGNYAPEEDEAEITIAAYGRHGSHTIAISAFPSNELEESLDYMIDQARAWAHRWIPNG